MDFLYFFKNVCLKYFILLIIRNLLDDIIVIQIGNTLLLVKYVTRRSGRIYGMIAEVIV